MNAFHESIKVRINRTLERMQDAYYTIGGSLSITAYVSQEPLPYSDRMRGEEKQLQIGDNWGQLFDCAWFHLTGSIPEVFAGEKIVLLVDLNGEGCVFDGEGQPVLGITTGTSAYEYKTSRKRVIPVCDHAKAGDAIDLWIDAGNNDLFGKYVGGGTVKEAYIATQNDSMRALYYDFSLLHDVLGTLDQNSPRAYCILYALNDAVNVLDPEWTQPEQARALLQPELKKRNGDVSLRVTAIGHAHIDLAWLWPIRETIRKGARTFSTALSLMQQYPDYRFGASQPQLYDWMKTHYPVLYGRIKESVKAKRWEPQGAMWVEPDTNLTSGESLVRQVLYGTRFYQQEFGVRVNHLWLPDAFGYSGALPQILKKSGIDYFLTIKISWSRINKFPYHTFRWSGIDGSEILCHMPPEDNYNSPATADTLKKASDRFAEKGLSDEIMMLYGIGNGGGGPAAHHQERLARLRNFEGLPPVAQGFAGEFFDRISKDALRLPAWRGELYLEFHQGTYTTQARNKKYNRQMETLLREAEFACTLAMQVAGQPYPQQELEAIWKEVLLYQFHDILPGSSIKRVYDECLARYAVLTEQTQAIIQGAYQSLAKESAGRHTLINSLGWKRSGYRKIDGVWNRYEAAPMSACMLDSSPDAIPSAPLPVKCLENELVKASFDDAGQITSILLKSIGMELLRSSQPANILQVYYDTQDAWDMDMEYYHRKAGAFELVSSQAFSDGPKQGFRQEYRYGQSTLVQEVSLTQGSPILEFDTHVDWHEHEKMLRTSFPLSVQTDAATCNIQYGSIKRPTHTSTSWDAAKIEVCAQRWADLSEGSYGAALLNDCKYGYRVHGNTLDLNLLRSTSYPGIDADQGEHSFRYAFYPHEGDHRQAELERIGAEFNVTPVVLRNCTATFGPLVACDKQNITVDTVKKCEDSGDILIRMYESAGRTTEATLALPPFAKAVQLTDLMERDIQALICAGGKVTLTFHPFEILTIKILS